jgi:AcrR family transcriptional regulator
MTQPGTRRRGEALREAVSQAALAEIDEYGVRGASMDRIAKRAGTGKASLYRRWPNVRALALEVFLSTLTQATPHPFPNTGSLREDMITSLNDLRHALEGPLQTVLRGLISEGANDPALIEAFQREFGIQQQSEVVASLQRAMARGEIPVAAVDPLVLELPAAMVVHRLLMTGELPSEAEVEHLIDRVILPLLATPLASI